MTLVLCPQQEAGISVSPWSLSCGRKKKVLLLTDCLITCLSFISPCLSPFSLLQVLTRPAWPQPLVHWSHSGWMMINVSYFWMCVHVCPLQVEWEPGARAQEMVRLWLTAGEEVEGRWSRSPNVSRFSSLPLIYWNDLWCWNLKFVSKMVKALKAWPQKCLIIGPAIVFQPAVVLGLLEGFWPPPTGGSPGRPWAASPLTAPHPAWRTRA